ncbi:MAG: DUF5309 family protein [Candidatus Riflebacteria bacterium]|nr:DUF5309 family protein [Candidatus Riflebacteria bacterium]
MALNNVTARGSRNSDTGNSMIIRAMDPKVYQKRANFAFFVTLLRLIQMRRTAAKENKSGMVYGSKLQNVDNPKYEWSNIDLGTPTDTVTTGIAASTGATSLVVGNISQWTAGDIFINLTTKERCLVTAVTTGTSTLTITRQWGNSDDLAAPAVAVMTAGDILALVGNAFEENADAPSPMSFSPDEFFNYTQIFSRTTGSSGTNEASKFYGDVNTLQFQKREMWNLFLKMRSAAYFRGVRNKTTGTNGQPLRTTAGLEQLITSNISDLDGGMSYMDFIDFAEKVYGYGGEEKTMICNSAMATLIQKEVLESKGLQLAISPNAKVYGIKIDRLTTIHGDFDFAVDRTLNELYPKTLAVGFALEMELIEENVLRPDIWKENVQERKTDGRVDQAIGECGLKLINEERHGIITVDLSK